MKSLFLKERIYALIIDFLFISILTSIFRSIINLNSIDIYSVEILNRNWVLNYNAGFIMMILYFFIFDFISNGISLGKKIINLKVEKTNVVPSLPTRIARTFLKSFLLFTILMPITLIFYFAKNEIMYDRILETQVIK